MARPIGIDLFAGAGGLSLGFEQAGFDIAAAVEIDPIHCATHEYNFPRTKTICASVVDLTGDEIRRLSGIDDTEIDVVFGGAPCQGFSMIGKRALDDHRNQLVFHYVRLVSELRPKYCVFENVKGLTLGKHAQFLTELIDALGDAGYNVVLPYQVLNASNYGVPQSRQRLFLIAARNDQTMPVYPIGIEGRVTVRQAIADLPDADQFDELCSSDSVRVEWITESTYARRLRGIEVDNTDYSYSRAFDPNVLTCSLITEHTELSKTRFLATPPGQTEKVSRFLRLDPEGLCNTLRAGTDSARGAHTSPRPIHPVYPRVLTVREAARLHSYPDWFRMHVTKWHGFRQIGNSVPPLLGRAVASAIMDALGEIATKPEEVMALGDESLLSMNMGEAAAFFSVSRNVIAQRNRKTIDKRSTEPVSEVADEDIEAPFELAPS
ncbi:DNA cytosine methyltransferase [Paraburkholderia sp. Ac-20336]|uniref:DNA cytosine methyltransferase n=1 Tax=Paraburkholderia sp. Ac-20336 TaxID=2703886 RepID=UPI00197FD36A|nr:DNA cytosine methyltransferase [Paraburkholderia sp. Ac-20336]MBN3804976.1 DNA cytosine methyltransferase [Paraburkholderia sp. Ac-20336]